MSTKKITIYLSLISFFIFISPQTSFAKLDTFGNQLQLNELLNGMLKSMTPSRNIVANKIDQDAKNQKNTMGERVVVTNNIREALGLQPDTGCKKNNQGNCMTSEEVAIEKKNAEAKKASDAAMKAEEQRQAQMQESSKDKSQGNPQQMPQGGGGSGEKGAGSGQGGGEGQKSDGEQQQSSEKQPEQGDTITEDQDGNKVACKKEKGNRKGECKNIRTTEVVKNNNGIQLTSSDQKLGSPGDKYTHLQFVPSPVAGMYVGPRTKKVRCGDSICEDLIRAVQVAGNAKSPEGKFTAVSAI